MPPPACRLPLAPNLTRALEEYRKAGFFVLGLDMDGDVELPGLELATEPIVIVVGSEGKGLSRLVRETCDQVVSIPMSAATESLNAGHRRRGHPLRGGSAQGAGGLNPTQAHRGPIAFPFVAPIGGSGAHHAGREQHV